MYHLDGQVSMKETNENERKTNKQKIKNKSIVICMVLQG